MMNEGTPQLMPMVSYLIEIGKFMTEISSVLSMAFSDIDDK